MSDPESRDVARHALSDLRVLAIGRSPATDALLAHLEDLGASVTRPAREPASGAGAAGLVGDVPSQRRIEPSADVYEVVVSALSPAQLVREALIQSRQTFTDDGGIWLSITPYGTDGPWAELVASDLCIYAESGLMSGIGERDRGPLRLPGEIASAIVANAALSALLGALIYRDGSGIGQLVDLSALAVMASNHEIGVVLMAHEGREKPRQGGRLMTSAPWTLLPCRDGYMGIIVPEGRWDDFALLSGMPELLEDRFATRASRVANVDELEDLLRRWLSDRDAAELYEWAQRLMLPWAPVMTVGECLDDPQVAAREVFQPGDGNAPRPRFPARFVSALEDRVDATPKHARLAADQPGVGSTGTSDALNGVRVLDFGIAWAGALAGRMLGDMGADVLKVETRRRLDTRGALLPNASTVYVNREPGLEPWNRSAVFVDRHRNKRSIAVELDTARGRALLLELASKTDIVIENFAPRVLSNLGVGFDDLIAVNPRIVYVSLSGFGHTGPRRNQAAFGDTIEQVCGSTDVTGYEDGPPLNSGTHWPDTASGFLAAGAGLAALRVARRTGAGIHVDLSELEVALRGMPDLLEFYHRVGRSPGRTGNRGWGEDLDGCYAARDGREVVVTIPRAARALLQSLGCSADIAESDEAQITAWLSAWIASRDSGEALGRMRDTGLPCGLVRGIGEVFSHPQLEATKFFQEGRFDQDRFTTIGFPARLSESPMAFRRQAPKFSEHYQEILREVANLTDAEVEEAVELKAISVKPGLG